VLLKGYSPKKPINVQNQQLGVAFVNDGVDEEGTALVNKGEKSEGYSGPPCERCGRLHPTKKCHAKSHVVGTMLHVGGFYDDEGSEYRSGDDSYYSNSSPPSPSSDGSDDGSISNSDEESEGNAFVTVNSEDESDKVSNRVYAYLDITNDVAELMFLNDGERRPKSSSRKVIPIGWILLGSQSTIDVFSNPKLLRNIHEVRTTLFISCNAGVKTTNLRGELPGYGMVWFYPDGIANILSLSRVKDKFPVTYDSTLDNVFHVHKHDKILKFREATRRLYYFDTCNIST
jgi:hypothetical protein